MVSLLQEDRAYRISQERGISYSEALAFVFDHPEEGMGRGEGKGKNRQSLVWVTNGVTSRRLPCDAVAPSGWWHGYTRRKRDMRSRGNARISIPARESVHNMGVA